MAKKQAEVVEDAQVVETPAPTLPAVMDPTDFLALLSDEEKAEILALTGQNANLQGERVPLLKVNYCDVADKDGNTIKKGNFVYGQSSKTVEVEVTDEDGDVVTEDRMENLGIDLGRSTSITILAYRQQYAYYNEDANKRCSSQVFGVGEVPVDRKSVV